MVCSNLGNDKLLKLQLKLSDGMSLNHSVSTTEGKLH